MTAACRVRRSANEGSSRPAAGRRELDVEFSSHHADKNTEVLYVWTLPGVRNGRFAIG